MAFRHGIRLGGKEDLELGAFADFAVHSTVPE